MINNNTGKKLFANETKVSPKRIREHYIFNASVDSIVEPPFTETYGGSYKKIKKDGKLLLDDK